MERSGCKRGNIDEIPVPQKGALGSFKRLRMGTSRLCSVHAVSIDMHVHLDLHLDIVTDACAMHSFGSDCCTPGCIRKSSSVPVDDTCLCRSMHMSGRYFLTAADEDLEFIGKFFVARAVATGENLTKKGKPVEGTAIVASGLWIDGRRHRMQFVCTDNQSVCSRGSGTVQSVCGQYTVGARSMGSLYAVCAQSGATNV